MKTLKICSESLDELDKMIFVLACSSIEYKGPKCSCGNHCEIDPDDIRHGDNEDCDEEDKIKYCKELYVKVDINDRDHIIYLIEEIKLKNISLIEEEV